MVEKTLREVKYKDRKEALKQKSKIAEGTTDLVPRLSHLTALWSERQETLSLRSLQGAVR